jgi:hypothetical protein
MFLTSIDVQRIVFARHLGGNDLIGSLLISIMPIIMVTVVVYVGSYYERHRVYVPGAATNTWSTVRRRSSVLVLCCLLDLIGRRTVVEYRAGMGTNIAVQCGRVGARTVSYGTVYQLVNRRVCFSNSTLYELKQRMR